MAEKKKIIFMAFAAFIFLASGVVIITANINSKGSLDKVLQQDENRVLENTQKINNERINIITKTVADVSPAVVSINVTEIREVVDPFFSPFYNDPFFRQFFGDNSYSREVKSLGSGFIITEDGYILTNDHVAGNATKIVVTLTDGTHHDAKLIGSDPVSDIALIKIEGGKFPFVKLGNSDDVIIGEWSIALGNPFGLFDVNDKPTVTVGVISATNMNLDPVENRFYLNMIQTDAAINGGNSGGPLVNSLGEVIGMNTIIYTAGGSRGSIGLGFAIPVNKVKKIIKELQDNGKIDRDFYTGLSVQDVDERIASYFNLKDARGVIVTGILKNSPASEAGLETGDLILKVDNFRISNRNILLGVLQEFRSGQTITLEVLRDNKTITKQMYLQRKS
ncbi:MAG: trypsin-like peptidase domain-containing protein [Ignavibacteriaceae bacterium]|nr:trypsin-like peptidase domain-containing protein [Ignavibacteriaceae bacterium]